MSARPEQHCEGGLRFEFFDGCHGSVQTLAAIENRWIFWLSIATAAIFVVLAIPRIWLLLKRPHIKRPPKILLVAKIAFGTTLFSNRLSLLVIVQQSNRHGYHSSLLVAALALQVAAAASVAVASPLEHLKSRRPPILSCCFLFLSSVYGLVQSPSIWVHYQQQTSYSRVDTALASLSTAATITEVLFLSVECFNRSHWRFPDHGDRSPEESSSILSLGLYCWLNKLLFRGYSEVLTMDRLYPLDKSMSVSRIECQDETAGEPSKEYTPFSLGQLFRWLMRPLGKHMLLPIIPRLCLLGFTFCQPFFLNRLLTFLSRAEDNSSTGWSLIVAAVLTYSGVAISTGIYWYYQERFQSRLRGYLISAIFQKTGRLPHIAEGESDAVTLMGADVERIYTGVRLMHEVWANILQIAIASWLLERQLGLAFLAPLIVVMLGFVVSSLLSKRAVPYQSAWMSRVQRRIGVTSSILSRIQDLRISGMSRPAQNDVQTEREQEIQVGERSRTLTATSATLSQLPQAIAPAIAFAFGPHVLDQTKAYTALSFLTLLTAPLLTVLQSLPILAASVACLRRIRLFLLKPERIDTRALRTTKEDDNSSEAGAEEKKHDEYAIQIKGGNFSWKEGEHTLSDINVSLPRGSITFAFGPVACGKSTLCRALLGETPEAEGQVVLQSAKVAYCDQSPYLFNVSIRDNIVGHSPFEETRYSEVLDTTRLVDDLDAFVSADRTIVGTKGSLLSGGQRQRISLARALYHEADILIIDDVLSGLDGDTKDSVCQAVFGKDGLLRKRGTTVLLCTHSLEHLDMADHVVALASSGRIEAQGTFEHVASALPGLSAATKGQFTRALTRNRHPEVKSGPQPPAATGDLTNVESRTLNTPLSSENEPAQIKNEPLLDTAVYWHWLHAIGSISLLLYLVLVAGVGFFSNFPTIWLKFWSSDSTAERPHHQFGFWVGIYTGLGVGSILCIFPASLIMLRTGVRRSGLELHRSVLETVMHSSLGFLGKTDVGEVLNYFSQDMNILDTQLPRMVNNMCFCLATALGQAIVIALSSAWLAVSYPLFAVVLWAVQRVYLPTSKRLRLLDLEAKSPLYTNFLDTIGGLPTIRAFGWFPDQLARNDQLLDESQRPSYLLAMVQQWLMLTMNLIVMVLAVLLVALATKLRSNAGNVGAALVTLITLGSTLSTVIIAYTGLETSLGAISRLKSFTENTEREQTIGEDEIPDVAWPSGGNITINNVSASYNGINATLRALSLRICSGEKVAICGRTGSGKSSVLSLLLKILDPTNAPEIANEPPVIEIDDVALSRLDRATLRERIISASQDPVFLHDEISLQSNLDPWGMATRQECEDVLSRLGLAPLANSQGGLEACFRASELSAGQKQLLSFARAVLRVRVKARLTGVNGGLLLLDEVTANADEELQQRVRTILRQDMSMYTVLMVTHQKEMALACDRVLVMNAGQVVEDGIPGELMTRQTSWLRGLWQQ